MLSSLFSSLTQLFSDPEVGCGASASSIPNFAAQQPNSELSQSFSNKQPYTTQPWPDQSPFAISALDGESGQEVFELSKACGRGAGAKFNKNDLLCTPDTLQPPTQEAGQRPAGNTETPNNPLGPPPPDEHPGKPSNDHQPEAETRWGATQSWMQRMEATEDKDSDMCGKGQFAICDSGNLYFRIHQVGTIYYALLQAAWCKFSINPVWDFP